MKKGLYLAVLLVFIVVGQCNAAAAPKETVVRAVPAADDAALQGALYAFIVDAAPVAETIIAQAEVIERAHLSQPFDVAHTANAIFINAVQGLSAYKMRYADKKLVSFDLDSLRRSHEIVLKLLQSDIYKNKNPRHLKEYAQSLNTLIQQQTKNKEEDEG